MVRIDYGVMHITLMDELLYERLRDSERNSIERIYTGAGGVLFFFT